MKQRNKKKRKESIVLPSGSGNGREPMGQTRILCFSTFLPDTPPSPLLQAPWSVPIFTVPSHATHPAPQRVRTMQPVSPDGVQNCQSVQRTPASLFHDLAQRCYIIIIAVVLKLQRIRWPWHLVRIGLPEGKRPLGRPRHRWKITSKAKSAVFWGITWRRVVIVYRRFGTTYGSHPHGSRVRVGKKAYKVDSGKYGGVAMSREDGTDTLCRNVGKQLPHDDA
jgi:hypothetical protein